MKLSSLPWGIFRFGGETDELYERWFRFASGNSHLDGIDLMDRISPFGFPDRMKKIDDLRRILTDLDLPVAIFTAHPDFRMHPQSDSEKDRLKFLIEEAVSFDARYFRVVTWSRKPGELFDRGIMENVLTGLRWISPLVKKTGLELVLENHHETSDELMIILKNLKNTGLRLNYDVKSCFRYGMDPYETLERLLPYASTFHLDNFAYDPCGWDSDRTGRKLKREVPVQEGEIDMEKILRMIKESGFDGWMSVEYGGKTDKFDDVARSAEYVKKTWDAFQEEQ